MSINAEVVVNGSSGFPVFRCEECEYETFSMATLGSHKKTHGCSKKLFQCDVCNMKFSQAANMRRHKMRHTGIKPFECRVCPKRFFRKDHLMEHMVTHSKQLPFVCPNCGKCFHRQVHLKEHLTNEHAGSMGSSVISDRICSVCGYRAATTKGAKLHFTTRHGRQKVNKNKSINNNNNDDCSENNNEKQSTASPPLPPLSSNNPSSNLPHIDNTESSLAVKPNSPPPQPTSTVTVLSPRTATYITHSSSSMYGYSGSDREMVSKTGTTAVVASLPTNSVVYPGMISLMIDGAHHTSVPLTNLSTASSAPPPSTQVLQPASRLGDEQQSERLTTTPTANCEVSIIKQESPDQLCTDDDEPSSSLSGEFEHCPAMSPYASNPTTPDSSRPVAPQPSQTVETRYRQNGSSDDSMGVATNSTMAELRCPHCGIIFPDQTLYFLHKGLHSEGNPWKCNICGDGCQDKYDFNAHILSKAHQ